MCNDLGKVLTCVGICLWSRTWLLWFSSGLWTWLLSEHHRANSGVQWPRSEWEVSLVQAMPCGFIWRQGWQYRVHSMPWVPQDQLPWCQVSGWML